MWPRSTLSRVTAFQSRSSLKMQSVHPSGLRVPVRESEVTRYGECETMQGTWSLLLPVNAYCLLVYKCKASRVLFICLKGKKKICVYSSGCNVNWCHGYREWLDNWLCISRFKRTCCIAGPRWHGTVTALVNIRRNLRDAVPHSIGHKSPQQQRRRGQDARWFLGQSKSSQRLMSTRRAILCPKVSKTARLSPASPHSSSSWWACLKSLHPGEKLWVVLFFQTWVRAASVHFPSESLKASQLCREVRSIAAVSNYFY